MSVQNAPLNTNKQPVSEKERVRDNVHLSHGVVLSYKNWAPCVINNETMPVLNMCPLPPRKIKRAILAEATTTTLRAA